MKLQRARSGVPVGLHGRQHHQRTYVERHDIQTE
jgi:hypothetical protein